jgi:very-short-patch-repair endonuclease
MSDPERVFVFQLRAAGILDYHQEYMFALADTGRKWRADFCWLPERVILEIEGGTRSGKSRHTKHDGFTKDLDKYNTATLLGYKVYRVTTEMVHDGTALQWVERALGRQKEHAA